MNVVTQTDTQRWYRGYGHDQYVYWAQQGQNRFLGGDFEVESYDELEKYVHSISFFSSKTAEDLGIGTNFAN